ncbi:protein DAY-LENGTH-DEPENDENT DELAYED-GREENING 1, chloroplastic [Euphorbia lathyris]|uniref:protein DAY-LENGTH-DEPENDENT DELAYED-GREENING 1, chloroplastic n=1 Tax=Euphorbia lathyris TaxID=212925 RepID=UPI00331421FB
MSTSIVLSQSLVFIEQNPYRNSLHFHRSSPNFLLRLSSSRRRRRFCELVPSAKNKRKTKKKAWWQTFFFDEDGNWLGLKDDDMVEDEVLESSSDEELSEEEKFQAWKRRAEAIVELREAQEDMLNEESRRWEDWIVDDDANGYSGNGSWWNRELDGNGGIGGIGGSGDDVLSDPSDLVPVKGFVESVRDLVLGKEDDDLLYEDRIFRYASLNSAKFLAVLILVPSALDFAVHDYVLMPFLDRYVKTVPLAAQMLDVRKSQKLTMVKDLNVERARYRLEVEIGKSPPLSDEEMWWELRHKALELRDEWRLENRRTFANIWSDMVFGISLFILLYFNQNKVALLKFTGYKIINNISDTGKAFLIILITDIFLGYHSESGWVTLLEIIVDHYGFEVEESVLTIFVCLVPVIIDACVKLWLFKFLPRLSPKVSNIFQEMKRH